MPNASLRLSLTLAAAAVSPAVRANDPAPFLAAHCTSCHDADTKAGRLDLTATPFKTDDPATARVWVRVHDRVAAGEMPPKKADQPKQTDRDEFTRLVAAGLTATEARRVAAEGRATRRRLNRQEYEYAVRDLLGAPWLPLREMLPEDAVAHGFNTVGDALDVSHVQIARYLQAAEFALNAVTVPPPKAATQRYYAREQNSFVRRMTYSQFNTAPERATFPVLGTAGQPDVRAGKAPMTVGAADPKARELEGVGLVQGAYEPVEPKFDRFKAPASGRYKLRVNALAVWVGPNGANANLKDPAKLSPKWFIPNLDDVHPGRRSEPVALYAERPPRQLRKLGAFDVTPEAKVHELDVYLLAGETIRPDAARLFRSRPGDVRWQNPLAEKDGQPGVVYRWLEVEGPLPEPGPGGLKLLFGDLPVKDGEVVSADPKADAEKLLRAFVNRAYRRPVSDREQVRFLPLIEGRLAAGASFREAMFAGYTAVLCSPEFLTLHAEPGPLDDFALAARLSFFLWNTAPDAELRALAARGELRQPDVLRRQTQRLLDDPRAGRFVNSFLDYWLDLRKILDNSPDAGLYGDYYLDDLLTDSAVEETRLYFAEMLRANLSARAVVASDFAFVNERLAAHYGLPKVDGVALRKVPLPKGSVRGGLLTQASVLTVTANGTTTSPVVRGAWVMDRIVGRPPQPPPPSVPAVEPDLRGATTIREQLAKHRSQASCAACHKNIDPPGFALESFDVLGGHRTRYRALAEKDDRAKGLGKSGQPFHHKDALAVDAAGELPDGKTFQDVTEFKALLAADDRQLARNLVRQLTVYATGAPVSFRDRAAVETILDRTRADGYRTTDLIHALVQSELFRYK
jgi:mono/diheme cytochrome c family protein